MRWLGALVEQILESGKPGLGVDDENEIDVIYGSDGCLPRIASAEVTVENPSCKPPRIEKLAKMDMASLRTVLLALTGFDSGEHVSKERGAIRHRCLPEVVDAA
jgi:hypothetical protein